MPFDPTRHHRRSIRLAGYDYTQAGAYFVTICTHRREPLLASISPTEYTLTQVGQFVARCWLALPRHFPHAMLDAWVLMPDHIHLLARPLQSRDQNIANLAAALKRWTRQGFPGQWEWQPGSFDHLLREDENAQEKWMYVWMNPVRAGLVREADQWPFWFAESDVG